MHKTDLPRHRPLAPRGLALRTLAWLALAIALGLAVGPPAMATASVSTPVRANFSGEPASDDVRRVADWVVASGDHQGLPFIIVDKAGARLFLFDGEQRMKAVAPVLLGLARGDDNPPGIGDKALSAITPGERITPSGRFAATLGFNLSGEDILWVDYGAALSLHRITDPKPGLTASGRARRLASATTLDNRISHGCINVSGAFFEQLLRPLFAGGGGIVYVLPETRPVSAAFPVAPRALHAPAGAEAAALPNGTAAEAEPVNSAWISSQTR